MHQPYQPSLPRPSKTSLHAAVLALVALSALGASAQTVYRIVGPDGKVSFSDQPPPPTAAGKASVSAGNARAASGAGAGAGLPYDLQQVARRFPVTLYTAPDCAPCTAARNLLVSRGVPFTERTVNTNEDADALKRISGESNLPFGTIGGQQLKGFSDVEWTQYLDAAAYPKTSQLPATYRAPAATPLVAAKSLDAPVTQPAASTAPASAADQPQPSGARSNTNPAGIQF